MSALTELIQEWEAFLQEKQKGGFRDFIAWSQRKLDNVSAKKPNKEKVEQQVASISNANDPEFNKYNGNKKSSMQAAYLLVRMSQYVFFYTKPLMRKNGLHSLDDFGYLQNIKLYGSISKSRVCELMLHEITTGADIIKRLISNGFIKEKINKEDKRAKLLELTAKGNKVLDTMFFDFVNLPDTLGNMPEKERTALIKWLIDLDIYHNSEIKAISKENKMKNN
jgi:MarR family transcriptional regulator, lower aerobic nicotinate degradation pathway regulator